MKVLQIILAMTLFFFLGCSKDVEIDCLDAKLEELGMVPLGIQEVGCKLYVELYHHKGKQYYLLGSHCADMVSYPIDCDGNILCDSGSVFSCENFYKNAENQGIVGISE